jgi:hypothetical protein
MGNTKYERNFRMCYVKNMNLFIKNKKWDIVTEDKYIAAFRNTVSRAITSYKKVEDGIYILLPQTKITNSRKLVNTYEDVKEWFKKNKTIKAIKCKYNDKTISIKRDTIKKDFLRLMNSDTNKK